MLVVFCGSGSKKICSLVLMDLENVGVKGRGRKRTAKAVSQAAEKASRWL